MNKPFGYIDSFFESKKFKSYFLITVAVFIPLIFIALQLFFKIVEEEHLILYTIIISLMSITLSMFLSIGYKIFDLSEELSIEIDNSVSEARKLIQIIGKDMQDGFNKKIIRLSKNNHTKEIGIKCLRNHLEKFKTLNNGFKVEGHTLSIDSYIEFWNYLIEIQKNIFEHSKTYSDTTEYLDKNSLIFRSTHSNDIRIFDYTSNNNTSALTIRNLQKQFIHFKGQIVRIIISKEEKEQGETKRIMDLMRSDKIDVRFIKYNSFSNDGANYDFAWITNDEKGLSNIFRIDFIAIWISDSQNEKIASCEIYESRIKRYINDWRNIGSMVESISGKFNFPESRSIQDDTPLLEDELNIPDHENHSGIEDKFKEGNEGVTKYKNKDENEDEDEDGIENENDNESGS